MDALEEMGVYEMMALNAIPQTITAEIELAEGATDGVLIAQGGRFAGWSCYVKDSHLKYAYNWFDCEYTTIESSEALPSGAVTVRYDFAFDGDQPGAGGIGRLYLADRLLGEGRIERTVPYVFSADETMDIGRDLALPVTSDYPEGRANAFQGKLRWLRIDLEDDDVGDREPAENSYHRIMSRQ